MYSDSLYSNSDQKLQRYQIILERWLGLMQFGSSFKYTGLNDGLCNVELLWLKTGRVCLHYRLWNVSLFLSVGHGKGDGMYIGNVLWLSLKTTGEMAWFAGLRQVSGNEVKEAFNSLPMRSQGLPSRSYKEINSANNQRTGDIEKRLSHSCLVSFPALQGQRLPRYPVACLNSWVKGWVRCPWSIVAKGCSGFVAGLETIKPNKEFYDSYVSMGPCQMKKDRFLWP